MKKSDLLQHIADLYRSIEALEARVAKLEGNAVAADEGDGSGEPPPPSGGGPGHP